MPQRSAVVKVKTPVQGDDAWAVIKQPTYGDMMALIRENGDIKADVKNAANNMELTANLIRKYVLSWNWVGDDNEPMPNPQSNPAIVETLTSAEVAELTSFIFDAETIKKNRIT